MPIDPKRVQSVFLAAVEEKDVARRLAFVADECGSDVALRQRIEALLRAHDQLDSSFDPNPITAGESPTQTDSGAKAAATGEPTDATADGTTPRDGSCMAPRPITEGIGTQLGPYKLREKIGEGGMGVVYLAEQEKPMRRKVALKIIKPGMDTMQVVARFEAERQALALMDHPSIARVIDAGATETGRPYFVMELIKGVPITDYCDTVHLTPGERLEIFIPVCHAIHHAHQKGIIHRDVKPSNVLITMQDGKPVPKIIDFGIAKAIEQRLTERSLFTQHGSIMGTLEYMSPEQAEMSAMDVDTRTDIYALGVLLYELMTGSTPLDRARLRESGYAEILRRIREEEPPRPSTRLSDSHDRLPSVAALRRTEPMRLTKLLRGELDWIVMKSIEKDRTRRYESASGFARDIQRYLEGDPVEAGPPSASYRLWKYSRKHRAALLTAGAFVLLLATTAAVSAYLAVRAITAEGLAKQRLGETTEAKHATEAALTQSDEARTQAEAVSKFLVEAFRKPDPRLDGKDLKVVELLDQARAKLETHQFSGSAKIRAELLHSLGETYHGLGFPEKAEKCFAEARTLREALLGPRDRATLLTKSGLAGSYLETGRIAQAVTLLDEAVKLSTEALGPTDPLTLVLRNNLALAYNTAGRTTEAVALQEDTLKQFSEQFGADALATIFPRNNLALAYSAAGRASDAIRLLEANLKLSIALRGPAHPDVFSSRVNLGKEYRATGRSSEAIALLEENLTHAVAKLGPDHRTTLVSRRELAAALFAAGQTAKATKLFVEALEQLTSKFGPEDVDSLTCRNELANAYGASGQLARAIAMHEANVKSMTAILGADHHHTLNARGSLAKAYQAVGRSLDALALDETTLKLKIATLGPAHHDTIVTRSNLATAYQSAGRTREAIALHEENLKLGERSLGPDHPVIRKARSNLAVAYQSIGRVDDAIALHKAMLELENAKSGPDHPQTITVQNNLATDYASAGRWALALPLFDEALRHCTTTFGPFHPNTLTTRGNIAQCYLNLGRIADSIAMQKATLEDWATKYSSDHPGSLACRHNLAECYRRGGQTEKAIALHEQNLTLRNKKLGVDHPETLEGRNSLAAAYSDTGRKTEAISLCGETLELSIARFGRDASGSLKFMNQLTAAYVHAKCWPEAEKIGRECLKLRGQTRPDEWWYFETLSQIGTALLAQRKLAEAEPVLESAFAGLKAREQKLPPVEKGKVAGAGRALLLLYEIRREAEKAAELRAKLGIKLPDLPENVFAR